MASQRGRKKAVSENQKEALVSYLELNLWVARNQFSSSDGTGDRDEQWRILANMLNALGGASKSPSEWRKCWADQRNAIRKKYMAEKTKMQRSGINGEVVDRLDTYEQRVVAIITKEAIEGDGTREHGLPSAPVASTATSTSAASQVELVEEQVPPEVEYLDVDTFDPDVDWSRPNVPEASTSRPRQLQEPILHSGQANQRLSTDGDNRCQSRRRQAQRGREDETEMFQSLLHLKRKKLEILVEANNREKEERDMKKEEHKMRMKLMQAKLNMINKENE